jgi:hypothetical protein
MSWSLHRKKLSPQSSCAPQTADSETIILPSMFRATLVASVQPQVADTSRVLRLRLRAVPSGGRNFRK